MYFERVKKFLQTAGDDSQLFQAIADAPFYDRIHAANIDLGMITLFLAHRPTGDLTAVALSRIGQNPAMAAPFDSPFDHLVIPGDCHANAVVKATETGAMQFISDWKYLFLPALSPYTARLGQAAAGIEHSCVAPLTAYRGALVYSYFQVGTRVGSEHHHFMDSYRCLADEQLARLPRGRLMSAQAAL